MSWKEYKIETFNKKHNDIGIGKNFPSKCLIELNQVAAFYENESDDDEPLVTVIFKSGDSLSLYTDYESFKFDITMLNSTYSNANS